MFDQLKAKIQANKEYLPPDLSLFYEDIATIENLVPTNLFRPRMKGYTKKAARILFYRELTDRDVWSSRELWGKECWYIHEWLTGQAGETGEQETDQVLNWTAFSQWCLENGQQIMAFACEIRNIKLAQAKAQRQAQKGAMPF